MDEGRIFVFSVFFSLIGIAALFLAAKGVETLRLEPGEISAEHYGRTVVSSGMVRGFKSAPGFDSFQLCGGTCIKVVDFSKGEKLREKTRVSVEGKVSEYRGERELVAESVEILSG